MAVHSSRSARERPLSRSARERSLRRYCKHLLRRLDISPPLLVDELCRKLGDHRGKPIRLIPWELPVPGPFGVWMSLPKADYIFYQQETTRVHQDHIILHEVGHVLAEHQNTENPDVGNPDADRPAPGPSLPDNLIKQQLHRTAYTEDHEREAELVATIIQEWAMIIDYVTPRASEDSALDSLRSALDPHWGWT